MTAVRVGELFEITKRLSKHVYAGKNIKSYEEVAIKFERENHEISPMLQYESRIYQKLRRSEGIPRIYWYGVDGDFRVMAMSIHGPNLGNLLKFCGG